MKLILKYGLITAVVCFSIYLYQNLLGAIPLLILSLYFFYEAFAEIAGNSVSRAKVDLTKGNCPEAASK